MYLLQGTASFAGVTIFTHNTAERDGGALYAISATIVTNDTVNFSFNRAQNGGAVYLKGEVSMMMPGNTHLNSSFNAATAYGGGIYHEDNAASIQCHYNYTQFAEAPNCFIHIEETFRDFIRLSSYQDSAGIDGNFLFGGLLDRCQMDHHYELFHYQGLKTMYQLLTEAKPHILTVVKRNNNTQGVTSRAYELCFCHSPSHSQDCAGSRSMVIHRGQKFTLSLVAIAQGNIITNTTVIAITSPTASLKLGQNPQHLPQYCSNLTYNLHSTIEKEELILYPEGPCHDTGYARVVLNLTLLPCPDGFTLASDGECVCEDRLLEHNVSCIINEDIYFRRKAGAEFWMGAEYVNGVYEGLILYKTCPVEYCRTNEVNLTLHDLDTQCAHGRIGVLCGGCAENYSLLIGTSKCKECSNTYLLLILPFAAAGIALVAFLSILRLTVATGMINSLILYANIVQVNRKLFFPASTANILTIFIAWLNLDLGFETCFFDGMDEFAQTCLQFAFPVYVWVLISVIILTSRYSITVSKLIGHNPIAVLATLLLMSYTKVLKIVIEVYSSVKLDYPHNMTVTVWLKDANVPYLQSNHLVLTVVTSLILFFPYTLLLLLGHKLYRFSGRKYFRWLSRMKPLLDSYYAPYKTHTRYWTGFLLLVRCALYIVFSFNSLGGTHESLLAIVITFTAVGFAVGFLIPGRIYKNHGANILEASAYLNLVILSSSTLVQVHHTKALVYSLVGIMFSLMLVVTTYHFHINYTARSELWLKLGTIVRHRFKHPKTTTESSPHTASNTTSSHDPYRIVSRTVIDLREPLLETDDS